jgi:serralysin
MPTFYGNDYNNVVYQDDYGSDLTAYAYGGNDAVYLNLVGSSGGFNTVYAGAGRDLVQNSFEGGNKVDLGSGDDVYVATGFSTSTSLYDVVSAGAGNDELDVSTFQSDYYGEDGNDSFFSIGFRNYFSGGTGIDTISYEAQDDDADLSGKGVIVDLSNRYAQTRGTSYEETLSSIENVVGTGAADKIYGSSVSNTIWADAGHDTINGRSGNDSIFGGVGNDDLLGSAGNDKLYGGSGNDHLYGGSGADTFAFVRATDSAPNSLRDVIMDFSRTDDDYIDLRSIDADVTYSGNQAFLFVGSRGFSGEAGELRFTADGILAGDVNGDGSSDFQIEVSGYSKMYSSDFFL